jgi:hypothetical protein
LVALPLLRSLGAKAQETIFPKRFITFYNPNGTVHADWFPKNVKSETEFDLNTIHAPLEPFKDRLLIFKGVDLQVTATGPGGPHQRGIGALFTGRELQEGSFLDGCGAQAGWANGISIDQAIANLIGLDTPLKSLELGVRAIENDVQARISYLGAGKPLPPMNDPMEVYNRLFENYSATPLDPSDPMDQRRSVLSAVREQFAAINKRVGSDDREKLEQHLELVVDLERRLGIGAMPGDNCSLPPEPGVLDPKDENDMPAVMTAHLDLLAMAFACDLTRVASIQVSTGFNRIRFPWIDNKGEGHSLSHTGESDTESWNALTKRATWHAEQIAYLMQKLSEMPEGDGSVLDNTVILWGNEVSIGNTHSLDNIPYLVAGNLGGALQTGRFVEYSGASNNDLLNAILTAYGSEQATFGHPDFSSGPLSGIVT